MPEADKDTPHWKAEQLVKWCLERAYKIAVHNTAIDWSTATEIQKIQVHDDQMEIASWLIRTIGINGKSQKL